MRISDCSSDVCSSDLAHEELSSTISWSRRPVLPYPGRHQRRRKIPSESSIHRKRGQPTGRPLVLTFSQWLVELLPRTGTVSDFHTTVLKFATTVSRFDPLFAFTEGFGADDAVREIGRAHVCTPVTNAQPVGPLLM